MIVDVNALTDIELADTCFKMAARVTSISRNRNKDSWVDADILQQRIAQNVTSPLTIVRQPISATTIKIDVDTKWNDPSITRVDFSPFQYVKSIILQCRVALHVRECIFESMPQLIYIVIGGMCFCGKDGKLRVAHCPKLKFISVGDKSFPMFNKLEVEDLPSLNKLCLGKNKMASCFHKCDCILRGVVYSSCEK